MRDFAWMVRRYENDILNDIRLPIDNSAIEGMKNKVKVISRRSYGFKNESTFRVSLYYGLGHLPRPQLTHSSCTESIFFTGAHIGEGLHAEWSDFDLENGWWFINPKFKCPSIEDVGWSPKWGKSQRIKLFPEALSIIQNMPKHKTVGYVKNEIDKLVFN